MNTPCKDCKTRKLGCHVSCELYRNFRTEQDKWLTKTRNYLETNIWSDRRIKTARSRLMARR